MINAKVSILGWLGWQFEGVKGVIKHLKSEFFFIFIQICLKLTFPQIFIKIEQKTPKLAFWGGLGGKMGVVRGVIDTPNQDFSTFFFIPALN